MALRQILLVRHGETNGASSVRYFGSTDVELSPEGRAQMVQVGVQLAARRVDLWLASTLRRSWVAAGIVARGASVRLNPEALGNMLSAFVAITPLDPSQPDDAPARLESIPEIESCHSVAGEESYVLQVRVASARALEDLLQRIRTAANVRTRSTIILQTFYTGRNFIP